MTTIRPATSNDIPQITKIWNHYICNTTITFNATPKTDDDVAATLTQKAQANEPFFVTDTVSGFATYGPFRNGIGYAKVKEHTILIAPNARQNGLGRSLMAALLDHGKQHNIQSLFAGINASNAPAIAFHQAQGFENITTIAEIGWKFDQWHDLVLMRKQL